VRGRSPGTQSGVLAGVSDDEEACMPLLEKSEPATPVQRRLLKTNAPGVYKGGARYVAITRHRGKRVKTYHRTKAEARIAKGERTAGGPPVPRFDDFDL
jgi:hypothetical protein